MIEENMTILSRHDLLELGLYECSPGKLLWCYYKKMLVNSGRVVMTNCI